MCVCVCVCVYIYMLSESHVRNIAKLKQLCYTHIYIYALLHAYIYIYMRVTKLFYKAYIYIKHIYICV
jgi:hypothetical protein